MKVCSYCKENQCEQHDEMCNSCAMYDPYKENDTSADYPLGGMIEPYDIEMEKNLIDE